MSGSCKSKSCANFRSIEQELVSAFRDIHSVSCKDCVYFSSRNCGMDTTSSVSIEMELIG